MMIVCDKSNADLAKRISLKAKIPLSFLELKQFPNGEYKIENLAKQEKIILLFPKTFEINKSLFRFLVMASSFRCKNLEALIPYLPYSRQDKSEGLRFVLNMIKSAGISKITTLDLHAEIFFDDLTIDNILPHEIFFQYFQNNDNLILVAPDLGAIKRTKTFAKKLKTDFVIFDKTKNFLFEPEKISGKSCLIVDDIVDSCKTLNTIADVLKKNNAKETIACISHGIFSKTQISANIQKIYISESFNTTSFDDRIFISPIHEIFSMHI